MAKKNTSKMKQKRNVQKKKKKKKMIQKNNKKGFLQKTIHLNHDGETATLKELRVMKRLAIYMMVDRELRRSLSINMYLVDCINKNILPSFDINDLEEVKELCRLETKSKMHDDFAENDYITFKGEKTLLNHSCNESTIDLNIFYLLSSGNLWMEKYIKKISKFMKGIKSYDEENLIKYIDGNISELYVDGDLLYPSGKWMMEFINNNVMTKKFKSYRLFISNKLSHARDLIDNTWYILDDKDRLTNVELVALLSNIKDQTKIDYLMDWVDANFMSRYSSIFHIAKEKKCRLWEVQKMFFAESESWIVNSHSFMEIWDYIENSKISQKDLVINLHDGMLFNTYEELLIVDKNWILHKNGSIVTRTALIDVYIRSEEIELKNIVIDFANKNTTILGENIGEFSPWNEKFYKSILVSENEEEFKDIQERSWPPNKIGITEDENKKYAELYFFTSNISNMTYDISTIHNIKTIDEKEKLLEHAENFMRKNFSLETITKATEYITSTLAVMANRIVYSFAPGTKKIVNQVDRDNWKIMRGMLLSLKYISKIIEENSKGVEGGDFTSLLRIIIDYNALLNLTKTERFAKKLGAKKTREDDNWLEPELYNVTEFAIAGKFHKTKTSDKAFELWNIIAIEYKKKTMDEEYIASIDNEEDMMKDRYFKYKTIVHPFYVPKDIESRRKILYSSSCIMAHSLYSSQEISVGGRTPNVARLESQIAKDFEIDVFNEIKAMVSEGVIVTANKIYKQQGNENEVDVEIENGEDRYIIECKKYMLSAYPDSHYNRNGELNKKIKIQMPKKNKFISNVTGKETKDWMIICSHESNLPEHEERVIGFNSIKEILSKWKILKK